MWRTRSRRVAERLHIYRDFVKAVSIGVSRDIMIREVSHAGCGDSAGGTSDSETASSSG